MNLIKKKKKIVIEKEKIDETEGVKIKETKEVKEIQKTKIKYYKKHCKLEIPFAEDNKDEIYEINEPLGYLEIKFDCDKYRQEEYFVNKDIKITLDK